MVSTPDTGTKTDECKSILSRKSLNKRKRLRLCRNTQLTGQDLYTITKILEMRNIPIENVRGLDCKGANEEGKKAFKACFQKAILVNFLCLVLLICSI